MRRDSLRSFCLVGLLAIVYMEPKRRHDVEGDGCNVHAWLGRVIRGCRGRGPKVLLDAASIRWSVGDAGGPTRRRPGRGHEEALDAAGGLDARGLRMRRPWSQLGLVMMPRRCRRRRG